MLQYTVLWLETTHIQMYFVCLQEKVHIYALLS